MEKQPRNLPNSEKSIEKSHQPIQLIVGLGNPGSQYEKSRHNAGFWFIDYLCDHFSVQLKLEKRFFGEIGVTEINGSRTYLLKPQTFMNLSGKALLAFSQFYKISLSSVLVIHDELDFTPGRVALKFDGGHGGHNGLRDIIQHLGSAFWRLRIGIGHPGHKDLVHDYVLSKPSSHDRAEILRSIDLAAKFLPEMVEGNFEKVMKELHGNIS